MIIVLMGYMGAGKSVVGRQLAKAMTYTFYDLDNYIETKEQKTISELFKTKGELYFRKREAQALEALLQDNQNLVLSLGGGTPCYGNNLELINATSGVVSFYLKTAIPVLAKRFLNEPHKRPLIAHLTSEAELIEYVGKHLFERSPYYNQSDFTIVTDHKPVDVIVKDIIAKLKNPLV